MKSISKIIAAVIILLGFMACKSKSPIEGFELTDGGTCFKVHKTGKGTELPKDSEVVFMTMKFVNLDDSVLFDFTINPQTGEPYGLSMKKAEFKGDLYDMIRRFHIGDSVTCYMELDTLVKYYPREFKLPKPLDTMKYAGFSFRLDSIWSSAKLNDMRKKYEEMAAKEQAKQKAIQDTLGPMQARAREKEPKLKEEDAKLLKKYLADNKISAKPDEKGIYFIEKNPGTGEVIQPGTPIGVRYKGMFLDGSIFDTNTLLPDVQDPLRFRAGIDPMVEGFTSVCLRMRKGGKVLCILPPAMGYGDGLTRVFEIEVVELGDEVMSKMGR